MPETPNAPAADTGGQGEQPTVESDFLADAKERLYGLFHLITFRGLRRGEACGLRKTDRNRAQEILTIATQLVLDGWEVIENTPKTDNGERIVALDDYTDEVLDDQELRQEAERLEWGEAWVDSGLMFTLPDGSPSHPGEQPVLDQTAELVVDKALADRRGCCRARWPHNGHTWGHEDHRPFPSRRVRA
ncbi:hypothetical protein [Streptomyces sp. 2323.1]|uniref:hypothetical protein n=1 Tax=Streptomyces sp. 2323.1 TaxID=1938841 RepID=UPI0018D56244|nr:hypothetical protein [Streptomyces sp. 2323.1]